MGLRDVVARCMTVLGDNFNTDMLALVQAAGLENQVDVNVTLFSRRNAGQVATLYRGEKLPGIGVYVLRGTTHAAWANKVRLWRCNVAFDYLAAGPSRKEDADLLMQQAELAVEAILRTVDRLSGDPVGLVSGAGEAEDSVAVDLAPVTLEQVRGPQVRALVRVPVTDEDVLT